MFVRQRVLTEARVVQSSSTITPSPPTVDHFPSSGVTNTRGSRRLLFKTYARRRTAADRFRLQHRPSFEGETQTDTCVAGSSPPTSRAAAAPRFSEDALEDTDNFPPSTIRLRRAKNVLAERAPPQTRTEQERQLFIPSATLSLPLPDRRRSQEARTTTTPPTAAAATHPVRRCARRAWTPRRW